VTLDEIRDVLCRCEPSAWAYADEEASAMHLHDTRLTLSFPFRRRRDRELGEPWTDGYPPVWSGDVTVMVAGEVVEAVPGLCVRGTAYLPLPAITGRRVVPAWNRGLFLLVSARSPTVSYGVGEFEALWQEFGFGQTKRKPPNGLLGGRSDGGLRPISSRPRVCRIASRYVGARLAPGRREAHQ
jgi:hypothetical protein